jgi:hypothetical protein
MSAINLTPQQLRKADDIPPISQTCTEAQDLAERYLESCGFGCGQREMGQGEAGEEEPMVNLGFYSKSCFAQSIATPVVLLPRESQVLRLLGEWLSLQRNCRHPGDQPADR